jgi:formate hydrogenlyase subunit 6/NADH:ubiquinone oxidoreductase subunit I
MYLPKIREIKEALVSFFSAPYTTKFPATSYKPTEEYRGFPRYNEQYCIGCGACAQVCPTNAITIYDDSYAKWLLNIPPVFNVVNVMKNAPQAKAL